jgi:opacity protein-like surface antigen
MNRHTEQSLKGVNTLKLGAEFRPDPTVAIRFGYNYVSPMYNKEAYKSVDANSPGLYYSSAADYTNWESTNRFTCGVGYTAGKLTFDMAYQYSSQSGKFNPFTPYYNDEQPELTNVAEPIKVDNNRHQLMMTLGYSF